MVTRRDARTDANQKEIIKALEAAGAAVWHIRQPLDLLVAYAGKFYILEVKSKYGKLNKKQTRAASRMLARGCVPGIVKTSEEALKAIGAIGKD